LILEIKAIKLDFGEIVYLDNNIKSDTAIVLLHGFGGDKDIWNRFSAELDGKKRIIILDIPGHGQSVARKNLNYSIAHQSKMLSIFLEAIGIDNVHIVGNSMGGAIAISYAGSNPEKIKSLSIIDALGLKKTRSEFDIVVENSRFNPMLDVCTEEAFKKLLLFGMHRPPYVPGLFMGLLVAKKCERADIEKIIKLYITK